MNDELLKSLKVGDVVFVSLEFNIPHYDIIELTKVKLLLPDESSPILWLDFECRVLYTNTMRYRSNPNHALVNCKGFNHKLPNKEVIDSYVFKYKLFENKIENQLDD